MEEEGGCDDLDQGDNGWKIIHTDVFRFPPCKGLLCAVLGVGAQFLTLATGEPSTSPDSIRARVLAAVRRTDPVSRPDRHHRHGALRHVQRAPPRLHQLGRHRGVRPDQLRVWIRVVQLLHADRRPALGVEHHPHLVALLR